MSTGILWGLALCVGLIWFELKFVLNAPDKRKALAKCLEKTPVDWGGIISLLFGVSTSGATKEPESFDETELPSPNWGNIRPVHGEDKDPDPLPKNLHLFPNTPASETQYEEFNRRLFVHSDDSYSRSWPETTMDDFPTKLVATDDELIELANTHLRPGYPVIIDYYGWWKGASDRLELDDTYMDVVINVYLAIPADRRPVIISSPRAAPHGHLLFLRYGFEPYRLEKEAMAPHIAEALRYTFAAFIGERKNWMWFSVARMRKSVMAAARVRAALAAQKQREVDAITATVRQAAQRRHANRFAALWDIPVDQTPKTPDNIINEPTIPMELVEPEEPAKTNSTSVSDEGEEETAATNNEKDSNDGDQA